MSKQPKLTIIIVNFEIKEFLRTCLITVQEACEGLDTQIVVVDNASRDGSAQMVREEFPWAKCIVLDKNIGFAAANNKAIGKARSPYILLLNPDTEVQPDTCKTMLSFMEKHPGVGAATCRVNLSDGSIDPSCHRGFPTPWAAFCYFSGLERLFPKSTLFGQYHLTCLPLDTIHEIDSPSGAFYLVRRAVFEQVGLFDEQFFLYAEELDLSMRIKQAGYKVMYVPITTIVHHKGKSGRASDDPHRRALANEAFFQTMLQFYDKHYKEKYPRMVRLLVRSGVTLMGVMTKYLYAMMAA